MKWLAILCAGAAYWVLGALWYSKLFSKPWVQAIEQHGIKLQPGGMAMKLIVTFVANVIAAIVHTPAARPSTPSMKLTMFMSATSPRMVSAYASGGLRSTRWMKGSVKLVTRTPNATGITAAEAVGD